MGQKEMFSVIEALLFAYGDRVELYKIAQIIEKDVDETKCIMDDMALNYENSFRGIMIKEIDKGYQLCTKPKYYDFVKQLFAPKQRQGLSQAAFEALSIIAYNQPITRAKIEHIRGVNSDSAVSKLLERGLIKEAGRMDTPGKPLLYETTEEFLKSFGFKSCEDLPLLEFEPNSQKED